MSWLRNRTETALRGSLDRVSPKRREWVRAALAELDSVPGSLSFGWIAGTALLVLRDFAGQALLPGRQPASHVRPAGFAALLGFLLLLIPFATIAFVMAVLGVRDPIGPAAFAAILASVLLGVWVNLNVMVRAEPIDGLLYAVSVRPRLPNCLVLVLGGAAAFLLLAGPAPFFSF